MRKWTKYFKSVALPSQLELLLQYWPHLLSRTIYYLYYYIKPETRCVCVCVCVCLLWLALGCLPAAPGWPRSRSLNLDLLDGLKTEFGHFPSSNSRHSQSTRSLADCGTDFVCMGTVPANLTVISPSVNIQNKKNWHDIYIFYFYIYILRSDCVKYMNCLWLYF